MCYPSYMNNNSSLDPQSDTQRLAHMTPEERTDYNTYLDEIRASQGDLPASECDSPEQPYDGAGFPGCGDGSDDLADFNANEANDYLNE